MKHVLWISAFLVWILSAPCLAAGDCQKLFAYGNPEYAPYLWRSPKDVRLLVGANVDFLSQTSEEIHTPIEVQYGGTWARVQEEARHGRVDLIAGAFLTQERLKYLHFIQPPLAITRTVIWVNQRNVPKYSQWSDLKKLRGITVINNSFGQKFDDYAKKNLKIDTVATLQQGFQMLASGRVHYLVYEEWPSKAFVSRNKIEGVKYLEPAIAEEPLYLVMAKKSPCYNSAMVEKISAAHQKLMNKNLMPGLLKENSDRWDSSDR